MSRRHSKPIAAAAVAVLGLAAAASAQEARPAVAEPPTAAAQAATATIETVLLPSPQSPLVAVRLMLDVGSIHDPAGKEGLAALTALMVGQAGTTERTYSELADALYPMAASIEASTDREVTVIAGEVHRDTLADYTALLAEAFLRPAFAQADFERNKEQLLAYLTSTLRAANDEMLGLEALQGAIFAGHPYAHPPAGTVQGLAAITLDDVKRFYAQHYTRANLLLGVAGGYPAGYVEGLVGRLAALPAGEAGRMALPAPPKPEGRRFTLIDKDAGAVGIHIGYPLPVNRADDDYYPLMVANSYLGEHRTFHGRLMQQLRGLRGLNYGDYSYVEHWQAPPFTSNPSPNVPRRQQYFSVWVRPVRPETAHFALRNALYEVDRLAAGGMTKEDFELTRDFLVNYSKLWAQSLSDRLGFHMDGRFYDMPYYIEEIERRLAGLTVEQVNAAAKKYLTTGAYEAVLVTDDAAAVEAYLEAGEPSPITYNAEVPAEVLEADKAIQKLPVEPTAIVVVPVAEVFETGKVLGR
jgi:zinc protease